MRITRLDLDGAGSPLGLVAKILEAEPALPIPVPIEELAAALDIGEIADLKTEGFVGGLVTDETRTFGGILVQKGLHRHRRRFTIGHELGHFLMPFHRPGQANGFLCTSADMLRWTTGKQSPEFKMEVQANQFSAAILMPPPHLRLFIARSGDPDLKNLAAIEEQYDVSKEAAGRAYAKHHRQKLCIAIAKEGTLLRIYPGPEFPRLAVERGGVIPSPLKHEIRESTRGSVSPIRRAGAEDWLELEWGTAKPPIFEQLLVQQSGFATLMLWVPDQDDDETDPDEDRTAKERYKERMSRWQH